MLVDALQLDCRAARALDERVDADDLRLAALDGLLRGIRGVGDTPLHPAALDRSNCSALRLDLAHERGRALDERIRQRLDVVRTAEWVGDVRDAGFIGDDLLRA